MLPIQLCLNDFMGHRESVIDCTLFNSALIVGKDKHDPRKSNGVGKSSIFKAIDYVLYNVAPTKTLDKIVRDGARKCSVQFDFEIDSGTYRVARSRSRKGASDLRLYQLVSKKWNDISEKTNTETEKALHNLIKITYKAFQNCILFAQGDLDGLASASPTERKALLKEPLQITVYNKYEKIAKAKAADVLRELEENASLIKFLGEPFVDIAVFRKQIDVLKSTINSETKLRNLKQIELDQKNTERHDLQRMITSEASDVREKLSEVVKEIQNLEDNINRLDSYIITRSVTLDESKKSLSNNLIHFNSLKEKLEATEAIPVRVEEEIKIDLERTKENEHRGRIHIARLQAEFDRYNEPIPEKGTCASCRQEITSEHRVTCEKEAKEECKKISEQLEAYKEKLETVVKKNKIYSEELENLSQHKIKIQSLESRLENKKAEIQKMQELVLEYDSLIKNSITEKELSEKSLEGVKKRQTSLKETLDNFSIDDINNQLDQIKNVINQLELAINNLLKSISSNNTHLGVAEEKKRASEEDGKKLSKLETEKETIEYRYSMSQKVVQAFSSAGIPTLIIHTILDDLQLEANNLLTELRPGIELQFHISKNDKDTLDINYRINGKERDWEQLGGGQKVFIALSLKLGLSIVVQRRLGVDIKFLELDEVDQPLDKAGVDAYADVIRKWKDKFKVLVITHNDILRYKFENIILVEGDDKNGSCAKVTTSGNL